MLHLLLASLLWAFSFGLLKHRLVAAGVDPGLVSAIRLALCAAAFVPLLRTRELPRGLAARLAGVGVIQYGIMYVAYTWSFRFLAAHEVALLTVLTPLYVAAIHDALARRFAWPAALAAGLAVAAGLLVSWKRPDAARPLAGVLLVQVSNLAFAAGQVAYPRLMARCPGTRDARVFGLLYAGGLAAALLALAATPGALRVPALSAAQGLTLLYLGLVPSALGFFLWNAGARHAKPGTLAAMNNAKIPLAVLVSFAVFGERVNLPVLAAGGVLMLAAVWVGERVRGRA